MCGEEGVVARGELSAARARLAALDAMPRPAGDELQAVFDMTAWPAWGFVHWADDDGVAARMSAPLVAHGAY